MKNKIYILFVFFGILLAPQFQFGQVDFNKKPDDDLGDLEDQFQELFFEALKQKGIENYDRSVEALIKCIAIDNSQSVLYFELGKNYIQLKNFGAAEEALKTAVDKQQDNEWYLEALYSLYVQQNEQDKAIKALKQLVGYHPDYKEELVALYLSAKKYNEALKNADCKLSYKSSKNQSGKGIISDGVNIAKKLVKKAVKNKLNNVVDNSTNKLIICYTNFL